MARAASMSIAGDRRAVGMNGCTFPGTSIT